MHLCTPLWLQVRHVHTTRRCRTIGTASSTRSSITDTYHWPQKVSARSKTINWLFHFTDISMGGRFRWVRWDTYPLCCLLLLLESLRHIPIPPPGGVALKSPIISEWFPSYLASVIMSCNIIRTRARSALRLLTSSGTITRRGQLVLVMPVMIIHIQQAWPASIGNSCYDNTYTTQLTYTAALVQVAAHRTSVSIYCWQLVT